MLAGRIAPFWALACMLLPGAIAFGEPPVPEGQPSTSQPTSKSTGDARVLELIQRLGGKDFRDRDAAQRRLTELGEAATSTLIEHVNDANPEIAARSAAIIGSPRSPDLRVAFAMELLATTRPEAIERAVYLLFDDPEACCDRFLKRAAATKGLTRLIANEVADQCTNWRRQHDVFTRQYERVRQRNPEQAAKLLKLQTDGNLYYAEAAYWSALDAIESHLHPERDEPEPRAPSRAGPTTTTAPTRERGAPAGPGGN